MSLFSSTKGTHVADGGAQIVLTKLTKKDNVPSHNLTLPLPSPTLSSSTPHDHTYEFPRSSSTSSSPIMSTSCVESLSNHLDRQFPLSLRYSTKDHEEKSPIQLTSVNRIYPPSPLEHSATKSQQNLSPQQTHFPSSSYHTDHPDISLFHPNLVHSTDQTDVTIRHVPNVIHPDGKTVLCLGSEHKSRSSSGASSTSSSLFNEEIPEEGTLEEILCTMPYRNIVSAILLYTYRTFTTMEDLISTMDKIIVETLSSPDIETFTRDKFIGAFKSFLIEWLSPPHMEDFNQPPDFPGLYHVSTCVRRWRSISIHSPASSQSDPVTSPVFFQSNCSSTTSSSLLASSTNQNTSPFSADIWDEVFRRLENAFNTYSIENTDYVEKAVDPDDDDTTGCATSYKRKPSRLLTLVPHEPSDPAHLELFNAKLIASQLTIIDKEIFSTLVSHHCLHRVRYHRWPSSPNLHDAHNRLSRVVEFTLRQANGIASISGEMVLYKWILVAKELRALKNYNSLTSIAQTLRKLRDEFPTLFKRVEKLHSKATPVLQEVEKLSEPSGNHEYVRFLQKEEASGKVGHTKKHVSSLSRFAFGLVGRDIDDSSTSTGSRMYGAVPFLAPYLYDLTLALSARPDFTKDGRINFRKKLQEFYILCTIHCLQSSTKYYEDLKQDENFLEWYNNLELDVNASSACVDDVHSVASLNGSSGYHHSRHTSTSQSSSSVSISQAAEAPEKSGESGNAAAVSSNPEPLILRVQLVESGFPDKDCDGICYKSVMVTPNDMMPTIIRRCLEKFGKEPREHGQYQLIQKLHNKREIILPDTQNAYYAIAKDLPDAIHCELRLRPLDNKSPHSLKVDHTIRKHLRNLSSASMHY